MKLHLADAKNRQLFTGYGTGYLAISGVRHEGPVLVTPGHPPAAWTVGSFAALAAVDLAALLENRPEIIVLGTGPVQRFPAAAVCRPLTEAGIGLEVMNTPAACRTYNILVSEGRRVLAAMFPP